MCLRPSPEVFGPLPTGLPDFGGHHQLLAPPHLAQVASGDLLTDAI